MLHDGGGHRLLVKVAVEFGGAVGSVYIPVCRDGGPVALPVGYVSDGQSVDEVVGYFRPQAHLQPWVAW